MDSIAGRLVDVIGWIVGVALALIMGAALISHGIIIPYFPDIVSAIIGWSLIILTLLGAILAIATRHQAHDN